MKRFLVLLLSAAVILTGCQLIPVETLPAVTAIYDPTGYLVDKPMTYPDYTFHGTPDTDQLRKTVVQAMRDLLSIRWSTAEGIQYYKTGPVSEKLFQHEADTTYAGTLYSNASTGLFQFMEYYDQQTGRLRYLGDSNDLKKALGSSCADALIWAWNTVCNSITGPYYPSTMVQANGYLPVGGYTYNETITSFNQLPTYTIIKQNGQDVILNAFCQVLPGDAFVSTSDNHAMMAIDEPVITNLPDGSLDTENSYVMIQDQRGGRGAGFYESQEDGQTILYSGRTSAKFTFAQLLEKNYIPVSTAELLGKEIYEDAEVTCSSYISNLSNLTRAKIQSNYPLAVVNVIISDRHGNSTILETKLFSGAEDPGVPKEFSLSEMSCLNNFSESPYNKRSYFLTVEVVVSTGQRFDVISISL